MDRAKKRKQSDNTFVLKKYFVYTHSILIRIVQTPSSFTNYKKCKFVSFLICKWEGFRKLEQLWEFRILCHMKTTLGKQADHKTQELSHMDPMPFCGKVLTRLTL